MKRSSNGYILFTVIFCLLLFNGCKPKIDYPDVDQLEITDGRFLKVCNAIIDNSNRINWKYKQSNYKYLINSFVIRIGERNNVIYFQFIYGNDSSINQTVSNSFATYGFFYYKNNTFLVQYDTKRMIPDLFRKTGKQANVSFVRKIHKSFFSNLFEEKNVVSSFYDPIYTSFEYAKGEFVLCRNSKPNKNPDKK
jgi:hypothetical protein